MKQYTLVGAVAQKEKELKEKELKVGDRFMLNSILVSMKTYIVSTLTVIACFFIPIKPLIGIIVMCIGFDTITGIISAKKSGVKFESKKFGRVITKTFIFVSALLGVFVLDIFLLNKIVLNFTSFNYLATYLFCGVVVFNELVSIDENIGVITGTRISKRFTDMLNAFKTTKDKINNARNND